MRKRNTTILSIALLLSLLMMNLSTATAAPLGDGPVISPSSGGGTATLTVVPISDLPGTTTNGNGNVFPRGHASGDRIFGGDGVSVSGLVGYATLSFPLKNYVFGWTGSIYQFLNNEWVVLPTTIVQKSESNDAIASATIYSNGIYALQIGFKQPQNSEMKPCHFSRKALLALAISENSIAFFEGGVEGNFNIADYPLEKSLSYKIINHDPDINLQTPLTGHVTVFDRAESGDGLTTIVFSFPEFPMIVDYTGEGDVNLTIRVTFGNCYVDFDYPDVIVEG